MNENLKRKVNESDDEYQVRLTLLKQSGVDIDWSEIADLVGDGRSSEAYRKDSYGIRRFNNVKDLTSDNETLIEIKKQKVQLSDMRTDVNAKIRELARIESIIDCFKNEISNIDSYPTINLTENHLYNNDSDKALLLISDIHYDGDEAIVDKMNKLIDKTIQSCNLHSINQLTVIFNGDLINNELKTTIRLENRENVASQIVGVGKLISDTIFRLSQCIPYVVYGVVMGNHCRTIANYKEALSTDTYIPIITELINLRVAELPNVAKLDNYEDDERFCIFNLNGKTFVATHGDAIKNIEQNGIKSVEGYLNKPLDYLLLGHLHNPKEFMSYNKKVIINGAMTDTGDYAKKLLLKTPSIQKLMMIDSDGDIECTYDIKL